MNRTCIIAEIGTSHQGDLSKAFELIHAAQESGADIAKFQWVYADEIIHRRTGMVHLPTGEIPLYDRFKSLEGDTNFFGKLKEKCESLGLEFLCTPFGIKSAMQLWELGVKKFKIASPELNHLPLLELLGASGIDLIISSGVSRICDIEEALETIADSRLGHLPHLAALHPEMCQAAMRKIPTQPSAISRDSADLTQLHELKTRQNITLLHCMTAYPAPENEYNLLLLRTLRSIFGLNTGISDHSLDPLMVPVVSTILGATMIEKHFTLSNHSDGLDDPIALVPANFRTMVDAVRKIEKVMPTHAASQNYPRMTQNSNAAVYVLELLSEAGVPIPHDRIANILGSGVKILAPTEKENYGRTNRSIHASRRIQSGTILGIEDIAILRTEKILRPGLHPRHVLQLLGHTLKHDVEDGEGIRWQDILD